MRSIARAAPWLVVVCLAGCRDPEYLPVTPEITTASLADGAIGSPYSGQLQAIGGTGPYTWSLESVPVELSWLTVNAATGALTGTPLQSYDMKRFSFTARVTDSWPEPRTSTRAFSIAVKSCEPGTTVTCYYPSGEACFVNSLLCTDGGIAGSCGNGSASDDPNHCGSTCLACDTRTASTCSAGVCTCGQNPPCSGNADTCSNGTCMCGQNAACSGNADTCSNGTCLCGTSAACSGNADTCSNGTCLCGTSAACSGITDTCSNGTCLCGTSAACSGITDTCSGGTCMCGQNPPCSGDADTCSNGTCLCGTSAACSGNADTCSGGACKCGQRLVCSGSTPDCYNGICMCNAQSCAEGLICCPFGPNHRGTCNWPELCY